MNWIWFSRATVSQKSGNKVIWLRWQVPLSNYERSWGIFSSMTSITTPLNVQLHWNWAWVEAHQWYTRSSCFRDLWSPTGAEHARENQQPCKTTQHSYLQSDPAAAGGHDLKLTEGQESLNIDSVPIWIATSNLSLSLIYIDTALSPDMCRYLRKLFLSVLVLPWDF